MLFKCKKYKGFTLLELMIVIAILSVLVVILPKTISKIRENAYLTGIKANVKIVKTNIQNIVEEHTTKSGFATALSNKLNSGISNPKSNLTSTRVVCGLPNSSLFIGTISSLFVYYDTSNDYVTTKSNADYYFASDGTLKYSNSYLAGSVLAVCYGDTDNLSGVALYAYDINGKSITDTSTSSIYESSKGNSVTPAVSSAVLSISGDGINITSSYINSAGNSVINATCTNSKYTLYCKKSVCPNALTVKFATWNASKNSAGNAQDDLVWYVGESSTDMPSYWVKEIDINNHLSSTGQLYSGYYYTHVYANESAYGAGKFIGNFTVKVTVTLN